jgi:UV DNA damage endonuclease
VAAASGLENGLPPILHEALILLSTSTIKTSAPKRRASRRGKLDTNSDHNADIVGGNAALRAGSDADGKGEAPEVGKVNSSPKNPTNTNSIHENVIDEDNISPTLDIELPLIPQKKQKKTPTKSWISAKKRSDEIKAFKAEQAARKAAEAKIKNGDDVDEWDKRLDPGGDHVRPAEDAGIMKEAAKPPPVKSD